MYIPFKEGVFMRILSLVLSAALMLGLIFTLSPAAVAEDGVRTIELSSTEKLNGNMPDFDGEMPDFDGELPEGFEENSDGNNTLIYIFVALGSAAVTSGITLAVIFIIRKKKSAPETTEE